MFSNHRKKERKTSPYCSWGVIQWPIRYSSRICFEIARRHRNMVLSLSFWINLDRHIFPDSQMTQHEQHGDKWSFSSGVCFTFEYMDTVGFHWVGWNSFLSRTHGLHGLGECHRGLHQQSFTFGWAIPLNYSRTMIQYHAAWAGIELTTLKAVYFYHNLVDKSENHTWKIKYS